MKQKILGIYDTGYAQVQIVCREGRGGEFWCCPEKGSLPRIKIGMDYDLWECVVGVLLHELLELIFNRMQCRFNIDDDLGQDHASYLFVVDHCKFSDACAKAALTLSMCLPDLAKEYKKWKPKS